MVFEFIKAKVTAAPKARFMQVSPQFAVPLEEYKATGERDAILASSGMGKSYLTGVLMEETLENGTQLCVIDPEGEHFTLAERYPMLIIGGEHGHLPLEEAAIDLYITTMLQSGLSAVFDLSEHLDDEQQHLYGCIADALFQASQQYRRKIRIVVEEAQIYAPQRTTGGGAQKNKKKGMDPLLASQKIAKRGRKRALDSLWATQRPASISKDILSQCNRFWFGGITAELDYKAIRPFLNEAGIPFAAIKALQPGEFYFYSKGITKKIKVRKRYCRHAGATPEAGATFSATTDTSIEKALAGLTQAVAQRAKQRDQEDSEITILKGQIKELKAQNEKLREELDQERLATKVIERLDGSLPLSSGMTLATARRSRSRKPQIENDGSVATALSADRMMAIQEAMAESAQRLHPTQIQL